MSDRTLICAECGVSFTGTQNQWDRRNRGRSFCSRKCLGVGNRKSSKAWWAANPDTNTVQRPTVSCACCGKPFSASESQHHKLKKNPDTKVYCTRECVFLSIGHTETRRNAIKWMQEHPEVGGLDAARHLGVPYITLRNWRKAEGMPFNRYGYKTMQTCGECGEEFWPSNAQWDQREDYQVQVCSNECRSALQSKRTKGVPNLKMRKHGLYGLEAEEVKRLRRKIKKLTNQGAKQ
jgi:hypothetical protein